MTRVKLQIASAVLGVGVLVFGIAGQAFAAKTHQSKPTTAGHVGGAAYIAQLVGEPDVAHLQQDLKAGKTLLQIAEANQKFTSADALATAILAPLKTRMDAAAQKNPSFASQETAVYNKLHARVVTLVQKQHPVLGAVAGGSRSHAGSGGLLKAMATACNTQTSSLVAAFKAGGKSPLSICQATAPSMTQEQLTTALVNAIKTKLDSLAAGNPTLQQGESQILSRIQTRLSAWVVTPIPAHANFP